MHKMRVSLNSKKAKENNIDGDKIINEVEDLGFGATLVNKYEMNNDAQNGSESGDIENQRGDQIK